MRQRKILRLKAAMRTLDERGDRLARVHKNGMEIEDYLRAVFEKSGKNRQKGA